ncbi:armadillo repeat protein deleted in velo-cardio-facial syndrome homolog isoform X3 [Daphnia pulicaria]|uniref:armadillo repeat protein deleted in velo-cardio-facial syndrome homolog isoform X3 n=1 Tax=Daphnia pulicaria TaxID=35523 RepID=UPI001EEB0766|nr:armadillo repeat protein deleted in velo-cardio-facial syndrome homolog isoform X3 [Daphnia pulicaria]
MMLMVFLPFFSLLPFTNCTSSLYVSLSPFTLIDCTPKKKTLKTGLLLFPLGRDGRRCVLCPPVHSKNHFGFATHHLYSFVERQVVDSHEERTHSKTETFTRRVYFPADGNQGNANVMPQYTLGADPTGTYGHTTYSSSNGVLAGHVDAPTSSPGIPANATLVSRTKQQLTTQQVTTVTQLVREVQHIGPDGQPVLVDPYNPYGEYTGQPHSTGTYGRNGSSSSSIGVAGIPVAGQPQRFANYEHIAEGADYRTHSPAGYGRTANYADYEPYPHLAGPRGGGSVVVGPPPDYAYQTAQPPGLYRDYPDMDPGNAGALASGVPIYGDRPPTPPSPSEQSESPLPHHSRAAHSPYGRAAYANVNGLDPGSAAGPGTGSGYRLHQDDQDDQQMQYQQQQDFGMSSAGHSPTRRLAPPPPSRSSGVEGTYQPRPPPPVPAEAMASLNIGLDKSGVRWRDPDLHEVIAFLNNPNAVVKANAAAYLQHLCYNSDPVKQQTRLLGGIPLLVGLISSEQPDVHRNACGALRNLSYGRQNDENKRALHKAGGIPALVRLLTRRPDSDVQELVTGVLWNLSSCEELKRIILDEALSVLVAQVIIPHSGWDRKKPGPTHWTALLRNGSGILRNVSSAGIEARQALRLKDGVVEALLYLVRGAIDQNHMDNKSVENVICVLRNLSYRCEEVVNPNYDKQPPNAGGAAGGSGGQTRATAQHSGENQGCFGASRKKKDGSGASGALLPSPSSPSTNSGANATANSGSSGNLPQRSDPPKGMELLWQPDIVQPYLALLSNCSNPETLEAAAGAIQNLAACYWQPSIDIRAAVRKEKGLPVLVELLRMEVDRVVCAVATALRNLALDQRNKELIGKYAMRDLVQKLPSSTPPPANTKNQQGIQQQHDLGGASDETIAAVLATLNEVIKKNAEFARSLLDESGVDRLVSITRQKQRYSSRVVKFASQVLAALWTHQELRDAYKKSGWKESDFVSRNSSTVSGSGSNSGGAGGGMSGGGGASSPSHSAANSTLNRPMSSQGGTRYEDKTLSLQRSNNASGISNPNNNGQANRQQSYRADDVPLADMQYAEGSTHAPPTGGVRIFPPGTKPGEPVYAQVNRDKKRSRQYEGGSGQDMGLTGTYDEAPSLSRLNMDPHGQGAGDSWV